MSVLATQGAEADAAVVVETHGHDERAASWMLGVGLALLAIVVLLALIAPLITSSGPKEITAAGPLHPPGGAHLLGTDRNAIDVWSRLLGAARIDLGIAVIAVFFAVVVGTLIGVVVGFVGGWLEEGTMRLFDIIQAFPTFIFALTVAAVVGPGAVNLMIVIAAVNAPAYARLVRAEVRTVQRPAVHRRRLGVRVPALADPLAPRRAEQPHARTRARSAQLWMGDAHARRPVVPRTRHPRARARVGGDDQHRRQRRRRRPVVDERAARRRPARVRARLQPHR